MLPKTDGIELDKPDEEEVKKSTDETRDALEKLISAKVDILYYFTSQYLTYLLYIYSIFYYFLLIVLLFPLTIAILPDFATNIRISTFGLITSIIITDVKFTVEPSICRSISSL